MGVSHDLYQVVNIGVVKFKLVAEVIDSVGNLVAVTSFDSCMEPFFKLEKRRVVRLVEV